MTGFSCQALNGVKKGDFTNPFREFHSPRLSTVLGTLIAEYRQAVDSSCLGTAIADLSLSFPVPKIVAGTQGSDIVPIMNDPAFWLADPEFAE